MAAERSSWTIVRDQAPFLVVLAALATVTGVVLRTHEEQLFQQPWLLGLVPVVNAVGGNLGAVLGARLTSALHLGTLEPRFVRGGLTDNLVLTLVAGATIYAVLALVTYLLAPHVALVPALGFWTILVLVLGSGLGLTVTVIGLSLGAAFATFRAGLDPDDIVIPLVTNTADLLGVIILFMVSGVVL